MSANQTRQRTKKFFMADSLQNYLREDNIMLVKVNVQFKKGTTRSRIRFQIFRFKFFFHELAPGCNFLIIAQRNIFRYTIC